MVTLEGTVPDQATADEVRDKAAAVVGPDNVVVNYTIVAGAPLKTTPCSVLGKPSAEICSSIETFPSAPSPTEITRPMI